MNIKLVKNCNQILSDRATLFCFPFAGGGASAYNSWIQKMKDKVTVCPIQLPGREDRIMEKPYGNAYEDHMHSGDIAWAERLLMH